MIKNTLKPSINQKVSLEESKPSDVVSKIFTAFNSASTTALSLSARIKDSIQTKTSQLMGAASGVGLAILGHTSGATVGLHEVVGHGLLGIEMTSSDKNPHYQVDGWDQFESMTHAKTPEEGISRFFTWLSSPSGGVTSSSKGEPNGLGEAMGPQGHDAWISLTGSLPGLFVDSAAVVSGMQMKKRSPFIGNMLVAFGMMDNFINSLYPISAATMSDSQRENEASHGHDFANFAIQMSDVTHIPAEDIAISTAVFWSGFVPLLALLSYLHTKSHMHDVVPPILALKSWVEKAKTDEATLEKLESLYDTYPRKEQLGTNLDIKNTQRSKEFVAFIGYLLTKVPQKELKKCQNELLAHWSESAPKDRLQKGLTYAAVTGLVLAVSAKALSILSLAFSCLELPAKILSYATPAFLVASVASSAYQLYKDMKSPIHVIPKSVKAISATNLLITLGTTAVLIAALLTPGLNIAFVSALLIGCSINIALHFARARLIKKQFMLSQSLSEEVWNYMYPLWLESEKGTIGKSRFITKWSHRVAKEKNLYSFMLPLELISLLRTQYPSIAVNPLPKRL